MTTKKENQWLVVWYDGDEDNDQNYIPYRISCDYLKEVHSNWKHVTFPNRAGETAKWKRCEWMGCDLALDYEFEDMEGHWRDIEGMKVEDFTDITPYLIAQDLNYHRAEINRLAENLYYMLRWQMKLPVPKEEEEKGC